MRRYLRARMPTFYFSDGEIRKLVRFFNALSSQITPYIAQPLDPLTDQERTMARNLFSSEGAPCLKCHMTGDPKHDARATAPNFTIAKERLKPGWTQALDSGSGHDGPGHRNALRAVPPGRRPVGIRRPTPASFQRLSQGSRRSVGAIYVPVHPGRAEPSARERRFGIGEISRLRADQIRCVLPCRKYERRF